MVYGYTQLSSEEPSPTKENTATFPPSAPPLYSSIGYNNALPGQPQPLYPHLNTLPSTPLPMYPNLPQQPQPLNGQFFNPFHQQTGNPFAPAINPVITGQPEAVPPSEVIGNSSAAGNTAPQIVNYQITYYAPQEIENVHTEFINCCEDCCEDCCENWCLNCCLDCSKLTNTLFGGNTAAATNVATTTDGYTQLSNSSTPLAPNLANSASGLVWDKGFTSIPLGPGSGTTPFMPSNGSTPMTLGNGFSPLVKKQ